MMLNLLNFAISRAITHDWLQQSGLLSNNNSNLNTFQAYKQEEYIFDTDWTRSNKNIELALLN